MDTRTRTRISFVARFTIALFILANIFAPFPMVVLGAGNGLGLSGTIPLMTDYDLDATTYTAICTQGRNGTFFGDWIPGNARITTSSSSTTTTSFTSSTSAFQAVEAGDELVLMQGGLPLRRYVSAAASVNSITVNSAWTLDDITTGYTYGYRNLVTGTGAEVCWIPVSGYKNFTITFSVDQIVATGGIDFKLECRLEGSISTPTTIFSKNYVTATAASDSYSVTSNVYDTCRIMIKIGSADDGGDLTTNLEKLTSSFQGAIR